MSDLALAAAMIDASASDRFGSQLFSVAARIRSLEGFCIPAAVFLAYHGGREVVVAAVGTESPTGACGLDETVGVCETWREVQLSKTL